MAKLTRVTGKTFGETASATGDVNVGPYIGQFGSALAGTYNGTTDVATIQGLSAWSNGFIDAVTPSNQYPPLPEMTGALKVLSYQENYILQQGIPEWDSATDYHENGFCSYNGTIYKSLADNNLNNQPDNSPTYWALYGEGANKDLSNLTTTGENKINYAVGDIDWATATRISFTSAQDYTPTENGVWVISKETQNAVINDWMDVTDKTSGNSILSIGGGGSGVTLAGYFTVQAPAYKGHEYAIRVGNGRTYVYTYFYPEKVRS